MWQNDKTPEAPGRLENLKELVKALESFENLQGFLEHVSLIMDNESDDGGAQGHDHDAARRQGAGISGGLPAGVGGRAVPLAALHGRERPQGARGGAAARLCRHHPGGGAGTISFAANRRVYGQWQSPLPSRFIDELPEAHIEVLTPPGLYGGGYGAAGMAASASPRAAGLAASDLQNRASRADVYNSPGWKRMQARSAQRGHDASRANTPTWSSTSRRCPPSPKGDRVFHQKFGYGEVAGIEGDKLDIDFEKAGHKKVVAKFVVAAGAEGEVPF